MKRTLKRRDAARAGRPDWTDMLTDTIIEDDRWTTIALEDLAEAAAQAVLTLLGYQPSDYEIAVLACDDTRIQALNADFREKDQATNVLSWPSEERGASAEGGTPDAPRDCELGDIAISYDTCLKEATESGKNFGDHVTHLVVHGVLHLLGYDHIRHGDATLMENLEISILGKLGVEDPYREMI